jgi:hypothetical protein
MLLFSFLQNKAFELSRLSATACLGSCPGDKIIEQLFCVTDASVS